jgi:cytochrome P450
MIDYLSKETYIAFLLGYLIYCIAKHKLKKNTTTQAKCPIVTSSLLENIKRLSGNDVPFFMLENMRKLKSDIYKISLPMIPGGGFYVVGDQNLTRQILRDPSTDKPKFLYEPFDLVVGGDAMFTLSTTDPKWHKVRKGTAPAFSSVEVNRMSSICQSVLTSWMEDELDSYIAQGKSFDPSIEMTWITFRVILEAAFEYFDITREEYDLFHHSLGLCLREFSKNGTNPLRRYYCFLFSSYRKAIHASKSLQALAKKILVAYQQNENKSNCNTVIKLINDNSTLSEEQKAREVLGLMIGGHDTTGYQLSNTLVLMAKHPEFAEKLVKDLQENGMDKAAYTKCIIQESMRMMPVAATGSVRTTGRDYSANNGSIVIPKGSVVWAPFIIMFRNSKYFDDPDKFHPDRWIDATDEMKGALMHFSVGKRDCIGQRLATAELNHCVPHLLGKYNFTIVEEGKPDYFLTLKYSGARLKATKRL